MEGPLWGTTFSFAVDSGALPQPYSANGVRHFDGGDELILLSSSANALIGFLFVCSYYLVLWFRARAPQPRSLVTLYEPPRDLSPAMLRFVWKERFDDRTFWASVLSLVSKGIATLENSHDGTSLRATDSLLKGSGLPQEESLLAHSLFRASSRKPVRLDVTDEETWVSIYVVSDYLHTAAIGKWFRRNLPYVSAGAGLSLGVICLAAAPSSLSQWAALLLPMGAMAPAGYYGFFLLLRIRELVRAARTPSRGSVLGRAASMTALLLPCAAGFALGGIVLGATFGLPVVALAAVLVPVNVTALLGIRFPTAEGRQLLQEIAGFREFLCSVERLPGDRNEPPDRDVYEYERYLPYAVALEVEQAWCDKFVALRSAFHEKEVVPGIRPFYLGMWDGKAIEIVCKPSSTGRGF